MAGQGVVKYPPVNPRPIDSPNGKGIEKRKIKWEEVFKKERQRNDRI
jgi:hypothetical protein